MICSRLQLRSLASAAVMVALSNTVAAQDMTGEIWSPRLSPWSTLDSHGVDPIGETLLSPVERASVNRYVEDISVFASIAAIENSTRGAKMLGYTAKYGSVAAQNAGAVAGKWGPIIKVVGRASEDLAVAHLEQLERDISARIAVQMNSGARRLITSNGRLDRNNWAQITNEDLREVVNSEAFLSRYQGFEIAQNLMAKVTVAMVSSVLAQSDTIISDIDILDQRITAVSGNIEKIIALQDTTLELTLANTEALSSIDSRTANMERVQSMFALHDLPAAQTLALLEAGVLSLQPDDVKALRQRSIADRHLYQFGQTRDVLVASASLFDTLGLPLELIDMTSKGANLFDAAGAFAAASVMPDPVSMFSSGANLASALAAFGGGRPDRLSQMSAEIRGDIRRLSRQISENHRREMEALRTIHSRLVQLDGVINRRFEDLIYDVSMLQLDMRELLSDDIQACERLAADAHQLDFAQGLLGLERFFIDARPVDFDRCMNGLMSRQRVDNEYTFSGLLRADAAEVGSAETPIQDRQDSVRRVAQRVLYPSQGYLQLHGPRQRGPALAQLLYQPTFDLCGAMRFWDHRHDDLGCDQNTVVYRPSIEDSNLNPGNGILVSPAASIKMARLARQLAPWNGVLTEGTSRPVSRVISEQEAREQSKRTLSRRTRHLRALNASVRALELAIGQAEVMAATPGLSVAADVLDQEIIPAFAQARLNKNLAPINQLLAHDPPVATSNNIRCGSENLAWATLCLMEANPVAARNIIRMLIARRLARADVSWDEWRRALRSPQSEHLSRLLGEDMVLFDASAGLSTRTFGAWGIELPRVHWDGQARSWEAETSQTHACWQATSTPRFLTTDNNVNEQQSFYETPKGARCYAFDSYQSERFDLIEHGSSVRALTTERMLVVGLLNQICEGNEYYPADYCSQWRR